VHWEDRQILWKCWQCLVWHYIQWEWEALAQDLGMEQLPLIEESK
jgi:hypothetical protein